VREQAGITVDKFGGEAFRAAVSEGNTKLARLLLEKGADINYHKPDMVFPNASTAVTEAARHKNLPMVRWLIEQGADITIADKYGDRPYTVAVQNKNQELADYLKALEPEDWHNEQEKIRQLMPYKLPAKLNIINLRLDITHLYYPAKNSFQKGRLKRREIFTELLLYTLTT